MRTRRSRDGRLVAAVLALAALAGCGYSFRPPYDRNIRTVYVPVFKSQSFRRDINIQITDRLKDEIQRRTPYKVVGSPEGADATLEGSISFADKNMQVENPNNLPRQILATLFVNVKFTDNRLSVEKKRTIVPAPVIETAPFYGEIGETAQLGFDKTIDKLVRQIVGMMEEPW
jgi:hypothetical protein